MINVTFPSTNLVGCVFSFENETGLVNREYDDFGHDTNPRTLKKYIYEVPEFLKDEIRIGDAVIVKCFNGFQLCEVQYMNQTLPDGGFKTAPIVAKVDMEAYRNYVATEQQKKAMKAAIDRKKKQLEKQITYDMIAEKNPEFKAMLEEYRKIGGEF